VLITGDSDFSPLVSKLRENDKAVIGVGVKNSTSDLLIANCDEFIYYDDLVREQRKQTAKRRPEKPAAAQEAKPKASTDDEKKQEALDLVMETIEALAGERIAGEKLWGSMVKQALKRRKPGFNETYYGFRSFGKLLDEAASRRLIDIEEDEKSGGVIVKAFNPDW
jgi:hypothetical protein